MPEYRRLVAYIYQYQNGEKQKNCGYVKMEIRNEICRMQIQMKTDEKSLIKIYGFVRVEKALFAILLGEEEGSGKTLQVSLSMMAEHLNETPYSVQDLNGIWLKDAQGGDYISVWDDEPVQVECFVLELPDKAEMSVEENRKTVTKQEENGLQERWTQFCSHYPAIAPFREENGMECLQIMPKDISFLGKQEWQFGQNPFVRQGFLRYGHLLLGKCPDGRFILGVPGIYWDEQEHQLARMYGFGDFLETREDGTAKSGYWYHFLG